MERFYDPLVGQVLLDGQPINQVHVEEYRKQIALVSQEPVRQHECDFESRVTDFSKFQTLYSGTIRFNILLGATKPISKVTQEEIEAACRDANILEFIQSLPKYG